MFTNKARPQNSTNDKGSKSENNEWEEELKSEILPEADFYYSMIDSFNKEFISEEVSSTTMPSFSVKHYFQEALYLNFTKFDKKVSTAYLQISLNIANAILALPQRETERWNGENLYIDNYQPKINISKLFLEALLSDESIEAKNLVIFNSNLLDYLKTQKGRFWEDVTQSSYLSSIWNLMMAGEFQEAKARLSVRKSFRYVENLHQWTKQLNKLLIAAQSGKEVEAELKQVFDEVFNIIRSPYWKTNEQKEENKYPITMNADYVRFQLAIIRWLYIEKKPLKGHWNEVLAQVSE